MRAVNGKQPEISTKFIFNRQVFVVNTKARAASADSLEMRNRGSITLGELQGKLTMLIACRYWGLARKSRSRFRERLRDVHDFGLPLYSLSISQKMFVMPPIIVGHRQLSTPERRCIGGPT